MAAPEAYEQPTLNRSWETFLAHVPTILLIWIATAVISVMGGVVALVISGIANGIAMPENAAVLLTVLGQLGQMPFTVISSLVGVLFIAVPAFHYESGEVITVQAAFATLLRRPLRYLLAGALFTLALTVGFVLCIVPGIAVALVMPIYVNRIFLTDQSITEAFSASFQAVYGSERGRTFAGIEILAWLLALVVSVCTCGLGALLAVPVSSFYLQNMAYHKGVIS